MNDRSFKKLAEIDNLYNLWKEHRSKYRQDCLKGSRYGNSNSQAVPAGGESVRGAGVAIFRPYPNTKSPSAHVELEPEVVLANAAEASLLRLLAQNPTDDIESQDLGAQT